MNYEVKIIADSVAPCGKRLTTLTATYPRYIHSELLTHRAFARNAASSRAIPWSKMRQQIIDNPVIPLVFGSEQKGMQTGGEVDDPEKARYEWLLARDRALDQSDALHRLGVHKSLVNRVVEPWIWITTLISATEWANFFRLRCHPDAEIHFQKIAGMMRIAMNNSKPVQFADSHWHMPFIDNTERELLLNVYSMDEVNQISVARCARVSYLTHEGKRDPQKDLELFKKLENGSGYGHYSPFEHVAMATDDIYHRSGPFIGWEQYRKLFPFENEVG